MGGSNGIILEGLTPARPCTGGGFTRRSAHHHLRAADAYDGMLQEGAKVGFDLLEDATGPRRAMAVDVHCNGTWAA